MEVNEIKTDFAIKLQRQIYTLVREYEQCDRECLSQYGVTASQSYTLLSLPKDGSLSMNQLSEAMGLAGSTMTRIVDQLVEKKMVDRQIDSEDRRIVRITLTRKGNDLRTDFEAALETFFGMALGKIEAKDQPAVLNALEQVTQAIKNSLKSCCSSK